MEREQTKEAKVANPLGRCTIYSFNDDNQRVTREMPSNPDLMWLKRPSAAVPVARGSVVQQSQQVEELTRWPCEVSEVSTVEEAAGARVPTKGDEEQVWIPYIYRRDILSFLSRIKIDTVMRRVSEGWKFAVDYCPSRMLPRLVFDQLQVQIVAKTNPDCFVSSDGYAHSSELWGNAFQKMNSFHECCRDIKEIAETILTHQLVFPKLRANAVVVLRIEASWIQRTKFAKPTVEFACRNRLTSTTAGDLLHFLAHLDGNAFQRVGVRLDASMSKMRSVRGHINPNILGAYKMATGEPLQVNAKVLDVGRWSGTPVDAATVRTARQLFSRIACLSSPFTDENLDKMLEMTERRNYFHDKLEFYEEGDVVFSNAVDRIINHFDLCKASMKNLVPKVHFYLAAHRHQWPAMCPKASANEVVKKRGGWGDDGVVRTSYDFRRKNLYTGRPFYVRIETSIDPTVFGDEEGMCALKILHSAAPPHSG